MYIFFENIPPAYLSTPLTSQVTSTSCFIAKGKINKFFLIRLNPPPKKKIIENHPIRSLNIYPRIKEKKNSFDTCMLFHNFLVLQKILSNIIFKKCFGALDCFCPFQDPKLQHVYFTLSGLFLGHWVIGPGVVHSIYAIIFTYLLLTIGNIFTQLYSLISFLL